MTSVPIRREPPTFRRASVRDVERLGPRMMRVTVSGEELTGFPTPEPAASVRLLLPSAGAGELVIPTWRGNEFLLPDDTRPVIRTLTPLRVTRDALDLEVVDHGQGAASTWATSCTPGDAIALSGPGRGYTVDPDATSFVLLGDETAQPAIGQLQEHLPIGAAVQVRVATSGDALVAALADTELAPGTRVWAAGEASVMQRIRRHLFEERGFPRAQATVRGYWKHRVSTDAAEL